MPTAAINGADLYYEERGSGPPLLLMHGTGAYADLWNPVFDGLAHTYRVIAYDRRGFGRSASAPRQGLATQTKDAAALLKALDASPATVVGWSGGGVIALDLAASAPECVTELFLAEPAVHLTTRLNRSTLAMQTRCTFQRYLRRDPGAAAQTMYRWASASTTGGNTFDKLPAPWRDQMTEHGRGTVREMDQLARPNPSKAAIRSISCPVTILEGDLSDPIFAAADALVQRLIPHARVIHLTGAAHFLHIDQPQLWVDAVTPTAS